VSDWFGRHSPTLSTHFHDEPQISIVFSGHRQFEIGKERVEVSAGSFVIIPARIPHRSIGKGEVATVSKDVFFDPDYLPSRYASKVVRGSVERFRDQDADCLVDALLEKLGDYGFG